MPRFLKLLCLLAAIILLSVPALAKETRPIPEEDRIVEPREVYGDPPEEESGEEAQAEEQDQQATEQNQTDEELEAD